MLPALRWTYACSGVALAAAVFAPSTALAGEPEAADSFINKPERFLALRLHAEVGFLGVLDHRLQLGSDATYVDLRRQMGQDNLFFFGRLSGDLDLGRKRRHTVSFLYQPLDLQSEAVVEEDIVVEDVTFAAGTPLRFRYGFPFWRLSYIFDVLKDPEREVALGGALQIRNATITYAAQDGTALRTVRDIGPVPVLKFRGRGPIAGNFWMGGEIDGFYAPIRYINGGDSDVEGAIVDASLRFGYAFNHGVDAFLNVRYIGGGAQGTSSDPDAFSDGFNRNWLHFMSLSLGFSLR